MSVGGASDSGIGRSWLLYFSLAFVSMTFSATGPVAIIIAASREGGLSVAQTSSWLFASIGMNGLASIVISWKTRQPLLFLWTIPGAILAAPVIAQYGFGAAVGTYLVCAAVLLVLGVTNLVALLDRWVPMAIVMAMIAGLFIKYVLAVVHSTIAAPLIGASMSIAFFGLMWLERRNAAPMPPLIGAMLAGAAILFATGFRLPSHSGGAWTATPGLVAPRFDIRAISQLLLPMLITVIFVQNAQGIAVTRASGYRTSLRLVTIYSGVLSAITAPFGGCPSVLAGPSNAILVSGGTHGRHYIGALIAGVICVAIGVFATAYVFLLANLPGAYIAILAGLAMMGVLEKSFVSAFRSALPLSAMIVFVVTLSDVTLLGIGAAFWGVVAGCLAYYAVEKPRSGDVPA
ncbi:MULTISPECIES: benzoate/H(+) symporter BenE family transporter [Caballeronia]|uniref:Benzoate transporter n=1 Tax=Caballeronia zhejiangensis TaxID=871203 RepID=A0A656QQI2_9BURK|nr:MULTISPECIES: benzoate/H(+) symporter BenE family transporter [Caballeronia]EKS69967.1 benzoate membrane transport protein [Burkholderia sp. SJ98]KDR32308.1 benzoate transporter [Caballeronia zhejiangensis]MDR5791645.1 benzoate/H(+) symporter BenE family transporter [Caballeronia sp. LP003]